MRRGCERYWLETDACGCDPGTMLGARTADVNPGEGSFVVSCLEGPESIPMGRMLVERALSVMLPWQGGVGWSDDERTGDDDGRIRFQRASQEIESTGD